MSKVIVYLFLSGQSKVRALTETGYDLGEEEIKSPELAPDVARSEWLHAAIPEAIGDAEYEIEFVEDPGAHNGLINACAKLEGKGKEQSFYLTAKEIENRKLEMMLGNEWKNIAFGCLKMGDIFRYYEHSGELVKSENGISEFVAVTDVMYGKLEYVERKNSESDEQDYTQPILPELPKEETIEVESDDANAFKFLSEKVLHLKTLKDELASIQAEYNKQIKDQMKACFAAAEGKSFSRVKCSIEYDWEAGVRRWVNKDTGKIEKEADIPDEMRETYLNLPKPETVEEPVETEGETVECEDQEIESTTENQPEDVAA